MREQFLGTTYSGSLSAVVLMGHLAVAFPNQQLLRDGENIQVRNHTLGEGCFWRKYRKGERWNVTGNLPSP